MSVKVYLIVNGKGDCRLNKRRPVLEFDEVAFPIVVQVPVGWGRVYDQHEIYLKLPPAPELRRPEVGTPEVASDR